MKVFISDSMIIVNNKFEKKVFVYDRLNRVEYKINDDCFDVIVNIKNNDYTLEDLYTMYDKDFIDQLFEFGILTDNIQKNINNVKKLDTYNNVRIFVELTNKCNLKCKHCYGGFACTNNTNLNIDAIKRMIDNASKNGVYQFDITGGEPTLYPYLEELMEYVYDAGMLMRIFTNHEEEWGTFLDVKNCDTPIDNVAVMAIGKHSGTDATIIEMESIMTLSKV